MGRYLVLLVVASGGAGVGLNVAATLDTAPVHWGDLITMLKLILGAVGGMIGAVLAAIWAGGRWTSRIEAALDEHRNDQKQYENSNNREHGLIWEVLRGKTDK